MALGSYGHRLAPTLHQAHSAVPGLADFIAYGVVAVLELVEYKGAHLCDVDLAVIVKQGFLYEHVEDASHNSITVNGRSHLDDLALQ